MHLSVVFARLVSAPARARRAASLAVAALSLFGGSVPAVGAAEPPLAEVAREQFAFAATQYAGMLATLKDEPKRLPRSFQNGKLHTVRAEDWTSGFFPGALWLIYEHTGDATLRAAAEDFTRRVESIQHFTAHHDVGFMLGCSYGEGYRLTGDPAYRAILVQGARSLATRYRPEIGLIRSWDGGPWHFPVIVDNMMNLELLWFAQQQNGESSFGAIALSHADRTLAHHFRPDGSSYHLLDYDATGAVVKRQTVQGAADDSAWARGQAWGLHGFTTMARLTGRADYLAHAQRIADFLLAHPRLPADGVPYWDFDAPQIPETPRDASAATVMAVALLDLAPQVSDERAARYRALAEKQLRSLASPAYRAAPGANGHFLLQHSVGHFAVNGEVDSPLNYADYYFLKGLARYAQPVVPAKAAY